jgi:membrane protease YdiL (CAAX protease family)
MQPSPSKGSPGESRQFDLNKLFVIFLAFIFASGLFSALVEHHLAEVVRRGVDVIHRWRFVYPAEALFELTAMIVVMFIYRPLASLLRAVPPAPQHGHPLRRDALLGISAGLLVVLAALPILQSDLVRTLVNSLFPTIHPLGLRGVAYCLLFGLALPAATEIVFRGVVLRTLEAYLHPAVAITVAGVASAVLVPMFYNWLVALALGLAAGYLYHRRRRLLGPVIAAITTWALGTSYVLWRIWS